MLEKIGLPAKPSIRGSNWVVDASHCQGCSSQFTFINRKHHCRRCGGLFCNSCTQQRMVLRGQGDSPVRICDPCKKLEEAARFEMRHGHKSRAGRGGLKLMPKDEDDLLNQILGTDGKSPSLSGRESTTDVVSELQRGISNASCSSVHEEAVTQDEEGDIVRSLSIDTQNDALNEMGSTSPEELRQQALEEKKKYRTLKGEGKHEEALRAFKRGKELERQAGALEVALRKRRRMGLSSSSLAGNQKTNDDSEEYGKRSKTLPQMGKEKKDDLATELKELGWSDADLHDEAKKPAKMSLEGELTNLLGEVHKKSSLAKGTGGVDKTQVLAHKKKALMFKREGKLAEAKEELKRAKVLEKQLEEQEFLAEAEDSDDELSSLIRSMDDDKPDDLLMQYERDPGLDFNRLMAVSDDLDGNFEVTDEDMDDPEISAALTSLGWSEDSDHPEDTVPQSLPMDREALLNEILSLKREALNQKRAGNVTEAMTQLKKAKQLERDLESVQSRGNISIESNPMMQKGSTSQTAAKSSKSFKVDDGTVGLLKETNPKLPPRSKLMIQKELLGLKKAALALRREGRLDEAEEELKKGKILEQQLEEMESASKLSAVTKDLELTHGHSDISGNLASGEEEDNGDITEQDMHDPALLSLLKNLGWKDEDVEPVSMASRPSKQTGNRSEHASDSSVIEGPSVIPVVAPRRSKAEIQRELLGLKRKALALRRQGKAEEAEEVLRMTKVLEAQMTEIEVPKKELLLNSTEDKEPDGLGSFTAQEKHGNMKTVVESETNKPLPGSSMEEGDEGDVTEQAMHDPAALSLLKNMGWKDEDLVPTRPSKQIFDHSELATDPLLIQDPSEIPVVAVGRSKAEIQRELLGLKRKALVLRRQGESEEAEEVLRMAKVLEAQMAEMEIPKNEMLLDCTKEKELVSLGSLIAHGEHGNKKAVEEGTKGVAESSVGPRHEVAELSVGLGWKESNTTKPPPRSPAISIPEKSQPIEDKTPLIAKLGTPDNTIIDEHVGCFLQSGHYVDQMDLLTGDDWKNSQLPIEELENKGKFDTSFLSLVNPDIQQGTSRSLNKKMGGKDESLSEKSEKIVPTSEKIPIHEANSTPGFDSSNNQSSLRQEILARKRKAVSLKRGGKMVEAREELRQAKLLEKNLLQSDAGPTDVSVSTSNDTYVGQEESRTTNQAAPKPMSGRDRFKLQQESLAHKRQALKLRREGRMEDAEAEFELAKALETQLEQLDGHDSSNTSKHVNEAEAMHDLGIEDLLDPQLLSALKAIGLQDAEIVSQAPERSQAATSKVGKSENSSQERSQLEEQIKAEKVKALNLKRAGKQAEALDALRRAKQFEKKLNSLAS